MVVFFVHIRRVIFFSQSSDFLMTCNLSQIADKVAQIKEDAAGKMCLINIQDSHYARTIALKPSYESEDIRKNARDFTRLS